MTLHENTMGKHGPDCFLSVPAREMDEYRYGDGRPMERGHMVYVPDEGAGRTYLVAGWAKGGRVLLRPMLGGPARTVEAARISRM